MVRAGVGEHSEIWLHGGYVEIQKNSSPMRPFRMITWCDPFTEDWESVLDTDGSFYAIEIRRCSSLSDHLNLNGRGK